MWVQGDARRVTHYLNVVLASTSDLMVLMESQQADRQAVQASSVALSSGKVEVPSLRSA
jgi:hypothetical protein